jgi:hypothetical protein
MKLTELTADTIGTTYVGLLTELQKDELDRSMYAPDILFNPITTHDNWVISLKRWSNV